MSLSVIVMGACGRMGTTIANLALEQGHTLAAVLERPEREKDLARWNVAAGSDPAAIFARFPGAVVIDFTAPEASLHTVSVAARTGNPVVIGTTGFSDAQKDELADLARRVPVFWSPNMSVGVYAMQEVLPLLTRILGADFDIDVVELHHNKKKDAPSGTALRLGECLAAARGQELRDVACYHREGIIGERPRGEIGLQTVRGGDIVGVHTVYFMGQGERIEVTHQAHSRLNFAQGALRAAVWLAGRPAERVYSMPDLFA